MVHVYYGLLLDNGVNRFAGMRTNTTHIIPDWSNPRCTETLRKFECALLITANSTNEFSASSLNA